MFPSPMLPSRPYAVAPLMLGYALAAPGPTIRPFRVSTQPAGFGVQVRCRAVSRPGKIRRRCLAAPSPRRGPRPPQRSADDQKTGSILHVRHRPQSPCQSRFARALRNHLVLCRDQFRLNRLDLGDGRPRAPSLEIRADLRLFWHELPRRCPRQRGSPQKLRIQSLPWDNRACPATYCRRQ
jgi:hypothetical protein